MMLLKAFYQRLKTSPCLVCGKHGVEVAHLTPVSLKARNWSVRSHKDSRAFTAIPLCKKCHESVHHLGEDWLEGKLPGGKKFAYAYALRVLGEVIMEYQANSIDDGR